MTIPIVVIGKNAKMVSSYNLRNHLPSSAIFLSGSEFLNEEVSLNNKTRVIIMGYYPQKKMPEKICNKILSSEIEHEVVYISTVACDYKEYSWMSYPRWKLKEEWIYRRIKHSICVRLPLIKHMVPEKLFGWYPVTDLEPFFDNLGSADFDNISTPKADLVFFGSGSMRLKFLYSLYRKLFKLVFPHVWLLRPIDLVFKLFRLTDTYGYTFRLAIASNSKAAKIKNEA